MYLTVTTFLNNKYIDADVITTGIGRDGGTRMRLRCCRTLPPSDTFSQLFDFYELPGGVANGLILLSNCIFKLMYTAFI